MTTRLLHRIGAVSKRFSVSARTLRFYEERGLIKPVRNHVGYRYYSDADVENISAILNAIACGFTIEQIRYTLRGRGKKLAKVPLTKKMMIEKHKAILMEIDSLDMVRRNLEALMIDCGISVPICDSDG